MDNLRRHGSAVMLVVFAIAEYGYEAVAALLRADPARIFYATQGALVGAFFWIAMLFFTHPLAKIIALGGVVEQSMVVTCAVVKLYQPPPWVPPGQSLCDSVFGFNTYYVGMLAMAVYAFILAHQRQKGSP